MKWTKENSLASVGVLALIIFPLIAMGMKGTSYYLQIGLSSLMFAVIALSWDTLARTGQVSFAVPGFYGLGAYVSAILVKSAGFPIVLSMVAAIIFCAIIALGLGYLTLRLKGLYFAIATLAFSLILMTVIIQLKGITHGSEGISVPAMFNMNKFAIYYLVLFFLGLTIAFSVFIQKSKIKYAFTAIRTNQEVAKVMGINVINYKVGIFVISSCVAALMGMFEAYIATFIEPYSVFNLSIGVMAVAMAIFGGLYSTVGPVVGAIVLKVLDEILNTTIGLGYMIIYGLIIVLVILYLPKGVVGLWKKVTEK
jgi:branched-chain amino acid transport system permease protein